MGVGGVSAPSFGIFWIRPCYKVCIYYFRKDGILTNEKKCQSDSAFCSCFQILTQVVIIVTLFLCSVAYWILMTDQVNVVQLFIIHSVSKYLTKWSILFKWMQCLIMVQFYPITWYNLVLSFFAFTIYQNKRKYLLVIISRVKTELQHLSR